MKDEAAPIPVQFTITWARRWSTTPSPKPVFGRGAGLPAALPRARPQGRSANLARPREMARVPRDAAMDRHSAE